VIQLYKTIQDFLQDFIRHYRSLFLNPAGNRVEIVVMTALTVVVVIVLWLSLGLTVDWTKKAWSRLKGHRRPLLFIGSIIAAALAVPAVVFLASYGVTSSSSFCGKICHTMNPEYQSWRRSDHADVSCAACHADNGALTDVIGGRLRLVWHGILPEMREGFTPIKDAYGRTKLPNGRCEGCHKRVRNKDVDRKDLRVKHKEHVAAGLRCTDCHNRVAHPDTETYGPLKDETENFSYPDNTKMSGCERCHQKGGRYVDADGVLHKGLYKDREGAPVASKCESCHPDNTVDQLKMDAEEAMLDHDELDWLNGELHGESARGRKAVCGVCHVPGCADEEQCHKDERKP
jgi:hypothetical protein